MNSENTNVSLQAVLLTMMLEKIDNLSNLINEMQIASGDIKETCNKINGRIDAFEEKFEQVLQHRSSKPDQRTATCAETDKEKENNSQHLNNSLEIQFFKKDDEWDCQTCYVRNQLTDDNCVSCNTSKNDKDETTLAPIFKPTTVPSANTSYSIGLNKSAQKSLLGSPQTAEPAVAAAPSSVQTKAQTDNSKPAETKSLFGDKPSSLASPQPAALSPVKTQTVGSKSAGTKSLFGNKPFSFAPPPQPAVATSLFVTQPKESPFGAKPAADESQHKSLFGGTGSSNANKTTLSFSSFASGTSFLDKKSANIPNDVFGARTSSTFANQSATEENENPEEYVPDAHYEPVIPLPDKVEVVTGEESEEVLFKNRCKLYIFNSETKEVKERGVGDIKVLFNPENKNYRVVMRREQVHKMCANFRITKGMKIADKTGTKGCGIFSCIDFSENPQNGTSNVFYVKFHEEKVYEEFKKLFNEIAEGYPTTAKPTVAAAPKPAETKSIFGGKPSSLASAQPAATSPVKTQAQTVDSKSAGTKSLFGDKPFSLASPQPAAPSPVKTEAQKIGLKPAGTKSLFGNKPFSFAPPPHSAVKEAQESLFDVKPAADESQNKLSFGGTGSSNANKTPLSFSSFASGTSFLDKKSADIPNDVFGARTSSTFAKQSGTEENENPEEYVPADHYEPVIPLPDKVEVVTGEESEEVLFKNRCKLYIFNSETKEVKERGVGDIKVLYNPEKKNYRVVMRREQVHKICANFRITKGMNIADKTGTKGCGTFSCIDFSENPQNGTSAVFFVRFREENVYEEFKKLFNEIGEGNHFPSGVPSTIAGESSA